MLFEVTFILRYPYVAAKLCSEFEAVLRAKIVYDANFTPAATKKRKRVVESSDDERAADSSAVTRKRKRAIESSDDDE